ncbi:MAG TPA: hypothetical protein VEI80_06985 [Candidatus Acidoferrales bacterium]|nr:hypothetical protein [Candidatus Acidoferrales bacterium]
MRRVKTTVVVDEELLRRFKEFAAKNGPSRGFSAELEDAIRAFSPLEIMRSAATELGFNIARYPSLDEVSRMRPRVRASAGETVRELRYERPKHLHGH